MQNRFLHVRCRWLIVSLLCVTFSTKTCFGKFVQNGRSHEKAFRNCLIKTNVHISYPSNETWWYDSQGVEVPRLQHPIVVAYASSTSDVQKVVRCAVKYGKPINPRSGGHSCEAFCNENDHVVIDISRIAHVNINNDLTSGTRTADVGAGIRLGPLYYILGQQKTTFTAGTCPTVGLGGQIAVGGYGYLARMWGMGVDNVLELEMVDYRGRVLVANRNTNPDLFFALRGGGGGSYGIVVRMILRIFEFPKLTTTFSITWNEPIPTSEFIRAWFKWAPWDNTPREMTCASYLGEQFRVDGMYVGDDGSEGLERIVNASGLLRLGSKGSQNFTYFSSANNLEARAWLDNGNVHYGDDRDFQVYNSPKSFPFNPLNLPPKPNVVPEMWVPIQSDPRVNASHRYGDIGTTGVIVGRNPTLIDRSYTKYSSQDFVKEWDDPAFKAVDEFLSHNGTALVVTTSGGVMYSRENITDAYVHRQIMFHVSYSIDYSLPGTSNSSGLRGQRELARKILIALEPYTNHMSYQGNIDLFWTTDPKIYMPRYFGHNVKRLVQIKRAIDPHNFFNNRQSTPLQF